MQTPATLRDPERQLALAYAPASRREALSWLWALDEQFAHLVDAAREPTLALMRLTWWRDSLGRLDASPPPAQPLLQALAQVVLPIGVSGEALATLEEGWSALIERDDLEGVRAHAALRGPRLFALSASVLGQGNVQAEASGRSWALVERARASPDPEIRRQLLAAAAASERRQGRWPRALRPLAVLSALAEADARAGEIGGGGGVARLLVAVRAGLTGR